MAWIESHQVLEKHPKVLQLAKSCGWSIDETIGKLHRFWWWCLDYATDGRLDKFDHSTIASVFGVQEHGENVVQVLLKLRWLDSDPEIRVHDWWDYAGRFLQVRYKRTPKVWKEIKRFYGHSVQRTNNRTTTEQSAINNHKPNQPNLTNLNQPDLTKPTSPSKAASPLATVDTTSTWDAYSEEYKSRYGVLPIRNAKVNSCLKSFMSRVPEKEAPDIASFYVRHPGAYYVSRGHPVELLLRDAEKIRTEWASNRPITQKQAQQSDGKAARGQIWQELIDEAEAKKGTA